MATYIALLRKDPDSDFGVDFPDFPGCISAGSTLEEAREMATEALEAHVGLMVELGQRIPSPSPVDAVVADPDNTHAIPFLVTLPDRLTGTTGFEVNLPVADFEALDALAEKRGSSRQALLAEAVRRLLAHEKDHHAA